MTNTKFRKRALLSSVAMLLVALVALGSATFAWFVANPTATANGIKISAKAAPGIAIASETLLPRKGDSENYVDAYKATTVLRVPTSATSYATAATDTAALLLNPASPNLTLESNSNSVAFGEIQAALASAKDADKGEKFKTSTNYYNEKIYLKTSTEGENDTATAKSAKVVINLNATTTATIKNGIKVVVTSSKNELVGVWKPSTGDNTDSWKGDITHDAFIDEDNDASTPKTKDTTNVWKTYASGDYVDSDTWVNFTTNITLGSSMDGNGKTPNYLNVYVYLDGENTGVFSDAVPDVTAIVDSIDVLVSTDALGN